MCPASRPSDSDLSHPAVYVDFHARDVRRILRSQKRHGSCHFLGLPKPLHRNLRNYFLREFIDGFLRQSVLPKIGVTIGPGATVFTRMPRPANSAAAVLARERSAAFVAEYALVPVVPLLSATLVFKMIDAPSFSNGSAF